MMMKIVGLFLLSLTTVVSTEVPSPSPTGMLTAKPACSEIRKCEDCLNAGCASSDRTCMNNCDLAKANHVACYDKPMYTMLTSEEICNVAKEEQEEQEEEQEKWEQETGPGNPRPDPGVAYDWNATEPLFGTLEDPNATAVALIDEDEDGYTLIAAQKASAAFSSSQWTAVVTIGVLNVAYCFM